MRRFDRRSFIKIGSIAPFGLLSWGDVLRAQAAPKKDLSIIHLLLGGGMSHIDTFDMKPDLGAKYRSIFKPIPTNVAGLQVCEHLPLTAKQADKFTVIRSMTHKDGSHEGATDIILTGHKPLPTMKHPSIGSVVTKELGPRNELPTYVAIPFAKSREQSGFLGPQYNPFGAGDPNAEKYSVRDLELPMGVDWTQMESRYSLLRLVDSKISQWDTGNTFDSIDSYYERALGLMRSPLAKKAFDIAQDPKSSGRSTAAREWDRVACWPAAWWKLASVSSLSNEVTGTTTPTSSKTWRTTICPSSTAPMPRCSKTSTTAACSTQPSCW